MSRDRTHVEIASPIGPLTLVAEDGALVGLSMAASRYPLDAGEPGDHASEPFATAIAQVGEYFDGRRTRFDLPLELRGSPFQRSVWEAMLEIPFGETTSYGELAARIGRPGAARAVGLASGRNPIAVIVPCHRVVGSTGSLTGYGGGLPRKRHLLDLERAASELTLGV